MTITYDTSISLSWQHLKKIPAQIKISKFIFWSDLSFGFGVSSVFTAVGTSKSEGLDWIRSGWYRNTLHTIHNVNLRTTKWIGMLKPVDFIPNTVFFLFQVLLIHNKSVSSFWAPLGSIIARSIVNFQFLTKSFRQIFRCKCFFLRV